MDVTANILPATRQVTPTPPANQHAADGKATGFGSALPSQSDTTQGPAAAMAASRNSTDQTEAPSEPAFAEMPGVTEHAVDLSAADYDVLSAALNATEGHRPDFPASGAASDNPKGVGPVTPSNTDLSALRGSDVLAGLGQVGHDPAVGTPATDHRAAALPAQAQTALDLALAMTAKVAAGTGTAAANQSVAMASQAALAAAAETTNAAPGRNTNILVTESRLGVTSRPAATLAVVNVTDPVPATNGLVPEMPVIGNATAREQALMTAEEKALPQAALPENTETRLATRGDNGQSGPTPVTDAPKAEMPTASATQQSASTTTLPGMATGAAMAYTNSDAPMVDMLFDPTMSDLRDLPRPSFASSVAAAARSAPPPALPAEQVAMHIIRGAEVGTDRIQIRLHPAALGRVDVELEVGHDGRVNAVIAADRPATLELLQRDSQQLAKALQDAGLQTDGDSLNFSLRDGASEHMQPFDDNPKGKGQTGQGEEDAAPDDGTAPTAIAGIGEGRVDIHV